VCRSSESVDVGEQHDVGAGMRKTHPWLLFFGGMLAAIAFGVGLIAACVWGFSQITADNGGLTHVGRMERVAAGYEGVGIVRRDLGEFAPVLIMSEEMFRRLQHSEATIRFSICQGGRVVLDEEMSCEQMVHSPSFDTAFMPGQWVRVGSGDPGELRATISGLPADLAKEDIKLAAFRHGWK
jgi:hypothetical protein